MKSNFKKLIVVVLILQWPSFTFAQQQLENDPVYLQKIIQVILEQRNSAWDKQAQTQIQVNIQAEEITKLKTKIEELSRPVK